MREISEIEKDIRRVSDLLNRLVLERKLTIAHMETCEVKAKVLMKKTIDRMKDDKHWECGL